MALLLSMGLFFVLMGGIIAAATYEAKWSQEAEDAQRRVNERLIAIREGRY